MGKEEFDKNLSLSEKYGWSCDAKEYSATGKRTAYMHGNKIAWETSGFAAVHYPQPSNWIEKWTCCNLIENRYQNHRHYDSIEELFCNENNSELTEKDFTVIANCRGYMIYFLGKPIGGAGIKKDSYEDAIKRNSVSDTEMYRKSANSDILGIIKSGEYHGKKLSKVRG